MSRHLSSRLLILASLGLCAATLLHADPVDLFNPYNLLSQSRLAGDCFGCRPAAESNGVVLSLQSVSDLLGNTSGGQTSGGTYSGLLNLGLAIDLQEAVGWEGTSFKNTWIWLYGNDLSSRDIGNAMTVSSIAGSPAFRCYELWMQQNLLEDTVSLRGGLLGLDTEFLVYDTSTFFVNSAFSTPGLLSLNLPNGGPTYPMATPGIRLALQPTHWLTLRTAFAQGNPFTQQENRGNFDWNFGPAGGLLSLNEGAVTWNKESGSKGLPGTAKAGFWIQTGEGSTAATAGQSSFGSPINSAYSSGFYGILDQRLYVAPDGSAPSDGKNPTGNGKTSASCPCPGSKGLSSFATVGFAPQQSSPNTFYSDLGLVYTGLIPGRNADKLGLAFAYARMSDQCSANLAESGCPGASFEAVAELSYSVRLAPAIAIQPDLQYVLHPGGTRQYGNALVVGLRAVVDF